VRQRAGTVTCGLRSLLAEELDVPVGAPWNAPATVAAPGGAATRDYVIVAEDTSRLRSDDVPAAASKGRRVSVNARVAGPTGISLPRSGTGRVEIDPPKRRSCARSLLGTRSDGARRGLRQN